MQQVFPSTLRDHTCLETRDTHVLLKPEVCTCWPRCYEDGGKETYIVLAGKPLEKRPLGSLRRQNENSETETRELGSEDWLTELVLGRVR
jgi:hypothetical protein